MEIKIFLPKSSQWLVKYMGKKDTVMKIETVSKQVTILGYLKPFVQKKNT